MAGFSLVALLSVLLGVFAQPAQALEGEYDHWPSLPAPTVSEPIRNSSAAQAFQFLYQPSGQPGFRARLTIAGQYGGLLEIAEEGFPCRGSTGRERCRGFDRRGQQLAARISPEAVDCFQRILDQHEFEQRPPGPFSTDTSGDIWLIEEKLDNRYRWWANSSDISPAMRAIGGYFRTARDCFTHRRAFGFRHVNDCLCGRKVEPSLHE